MVLGIFIILNITLYASDYFTGDGINDAVLYTLTNSLTGAGVGKYILPGLGLIAALVIIFGALAWVLRRRRHLPHHAATACWHSVWRWRPWMPARRFIR